MSFKRMFVLENNLSNYLVRVFAELVYYAPTIDNLVRTSAWLDMVGIEDSWAELSKVNSYPGDSDGTVVIRFNFGKSIKFPEEVEVLEFLIFKIRCAIDLLKSKHDGFINARVAELFSWPEDESAAVGFEVLLFILIESSKKIPTYGQHFWYKKKTKKVSINIQFDEENRKSSALIGIDKNFFFESLVFYMLSRYPTKVQWRKSRGSIPILNFIYKHHYLRFGDWLYLEHSADRQIAWRIEKFDQGHINNTHLIEDCQRSGVSQVDVFKRAIARYNFRDENIYLLLRNNCEHFGTYCFYGAPRSRQVRLLLISLIGFGFCSPILAVLTIVIAYAAEFFIFYSFGAEGSFIKYRETFPYFPR